MINPKLKKDLISILKANYNLPDDKLTSIIIKCVAEAIHEDILKIAAQNHNDKNDTIARVPFIATVDQILWSFYGSEYDKNKVEKLIE